MSTALEENNNSSGSVGPTKGRLDVGPLLGLMGQAGEGDSDSGASDAVCFILTGLAVKYPLLVVPKVGMVWSAWSNGWEAVVVVVTVFLGASLNCGGSTTGTENEKVFLLLPF